MRRARQGRWAGQVLVMFALMLTVLIGVVGLAVDAGNLLQARRCVQNVADAAALAGGHVLSQGGTQSAAAKAAEFYIARNTGSSSSNNCSPTSTPAISFSSANDQITVSLTRAQDTFFMNVLGIPSWTIGATAVARVSRDTQPYAIIALDPDGSGIDFNGNNTINISGGGVGSNSDITFNGGSAQGTIDGFLGAMGEVDSWPDDLKVTGGASGGIGLIEDPFVPVPASTPPTCTSAGTASIIATDPDGVVMSPGTWGSAQINKMKKHNYLLPGVYCFTDKVNLNGSDVYMKSFKDDNGNGTPDANEIDDVRTTPGGGVLLYFKGPQGQITYNSGDIALRTIGASWKNLVIWFANCSKSLDLEGNGTQWIDGAVYAPCSKIDLGGNSGTKQMTGQVVGAEVKLHGDVTFNLTSNLNYQATPRQVYLVQ